MTTIKINNISFQIALKAALEAGNQILGYYRKDFEIVTKSDGSPVTEADKNANQVICNLLAATGIPIISEESPIPMYSERKAWKKFWLIDPLDGTREFVNKNDEFTVNIALIDNRKPVFGVVTAPALNFGYVGIYGYGAFKISDLKSFIVADKSDFADSLKRMERMNVGKSDVRNILIMSRTHYNEENERVIEKLFVNANKPDIIHAGSSLKFGLLSEGLTKYYVRSDGINEWDTAAGHALLLAAGGDMFSWPEGKDLLYNNKNLKNPGFVACQSKEDLKLLKTNLSL
ncbi:MAG: 3'(2'),5'-bisphosphate nucleotidase CysQ [Bacteroidetes bacterium]|nr:MAG: 3'(2'),5'-bisphosphate nucleotidase CysQ [Bacteroidota bacterium]